jgi:hypothetical protein
MKFDSYIKKIENRTTDLKPNLGSLVPGLIQGKRKKTRLIALERCVASIIHSPSNKQREKD